MDIKKERGSLTIEASIAFVIFMFLVIFFLNFGKMYIAQNVIGHATLQTAKNLSVQTIYSDAATGSKTGIIIEDADAVINFMSRILGGTPVTSNMFNSIDVDDVEAIVSDEFRKVLSADDAGMDMDSYLKWCGVKNGYSGISFKGSKMKDLEDVYVKTSYEVELNCPLIGTKKVKLFQVGKVKRFKKR